MAHYRVTPDGRAAAEVPSVEAHVKEFDSWLIMMPQCGRLAAKERPHNALPSEQEHLHLKCFLAEESDSDLGAQWSWRAKQ